MEGYWLHFLIDICIEKCLNNVWKKYFKEKFKTSTSKYDKT